MSCFCVFVDTFAGFYTNEFQSMDGEDMGDNHENSETEIFIPKITVTHAGKSSSVQHRQAGVDITTVVSEEDRAEANYLNSLESYFRSDDTRFQMANKAAQIFDDIFTKELKN